MHKEYITQSKKGELEAELNQLQSVERGKVLKFLEYAKGLGDLRENSEYHEARDAQGKLEDRIKKIEFILKHAEIIPEGTAFNNVQIGATVEIENIENGDKKTMTIVGPEEADISLGRISFMSPLGSILINKAVGEIVLFESPRGAINYKILNIR